MHYWADLQSVHGLRCYGNTMEMCGRAQRQSVRPTARRTHYACVRRAAKTPLTGDKIDAPAACAVPFRPYCGGVVTRTQNVSEYMFVLALCLVIIIYRVGRKTLTPFNLWHADVCLKLYTAYIADNLRYVLHVNVRGSVTIIVTVRPWSRASA